MAQAPPPEWQLAEELRIVSADGTGPLSPIGSATVSPDGRELFVLQALDHAVRVFDADSGNFLRTIGRVGTHPGEFKQLGSIGWIADTLYATDWQLKRVSLFAASGEHLETFRIAPPLQVETAHASHPIGLSADGKVISEMPFPTRGFIEGAVTHSPWVVLERDGSVIVTLALRDLRETTLVLAVLQGRVVIAQPLSQRNFLALHPDGTSMGLVNQPAGSDAPGTYEVTRLQPNGAPLFTRHFHYTPRRVSPETADRLRADYLQDLEGRPSGPQIRETVAKHITVPPFHPPISNVVAGRDDTLWLRTELDGDAMVEWLVLGPDGHVDATLRLPEHLNILYADASTVWATTTDESNTPALVRARIQR
jgi:hypothetical protein